MKYTICLALCGALLFGIACQKDTHIPISEPNPAFEAAIEATLDLPASPYAYSLLTEGVHGAPETREPLDYNLVTLGRTLFYDKALSIDNSVSCGSCHQQALGFADDVAFSDGVNGHVTDRNTLALQTLASVAETYGGVTVSNSSSRLFWDERTAHPEAQIMQTMLNEKEMGMDPYALPDKLKKFDYYHGLWQRLNGTDINSFMSARDITKALGAFMSSLQTTDSKFDQGMFQLGHNVRADFKNFSASENLGKNLFMTNCASCHAFSLSANVGLQFSRAHTTACNGLDNEYQDKGAGGIRGNGLLDGVFKIPGLRNIEVSAPYMHDGRFNTLEEVVEHYNSGVKDHKNLDHLLKDRNGHAKRLNLSPVEVAALVDFLKTLTDPVALNDPKWSDPFK
ncbi:MAG: cytochrome c peroxidase [Bacteroidota bacterium]